DRDEYTTGVLALDPLSGVRVELPLLGRARVAGQGRGGRGGGLLLRHHDPQHQIDQRADPTQYRQDEHQPHDRPVDVEVFAHAADDSVAVTAGKLSVHDSSFIVLRAPLGARVSLLPLGWTQEREAMLRTMRISPIEF